MQLVLTLFGIGFVASFLGGIIGLGGGFLIVPLLTLILGFPIKDAIFFSLISILLLSFFKNYKNRKMIKEKRELVRSLAPALLFGAATAAFIGVRSPPQVLQFIFSCLLIVMSVIYFFDKLRLPEKVQGVKQINLARLFLFLAGSMSGLLGVGGGIVNVPVFNKILHMNVKDSARLSFVFVFLSVATATVVIFYGRREEVYQLPPLQLILMLVGTVCGVFCSERVRISSDNIRKLFCIILLLLGIFKLSKVLMPYPS